MKLNDLEQGERGIITRVHGRGAFRKRITEMGFVKGKTVTVVKKAPLRDPVEYNVMGYEVSLRHSEAGLVEVLTASEGMDVGELNGGYKGVIDNKLRKRSNPKKGNVIDVALVGNPNSGKTTLFNFASGSKEHVGNYSGVTVDSKQAKCKIDDYIINIIDLPGTYSLTAYSPEELYVRKYILGFHPDIVINVLDASNIERNLYLTTQLIDMDVKVVVALNMYDELQHKGDKFNFDHLGKMIGIPFIPTVGSRGKGIDELFRKVIEVYEDRDENVRQVHINYGSHVEDSIGVIQRMIRKNKGLKDKVSSRFYAIKLLEKDQGAHFSLSRSANYNEIKEVTENEISKLETTFNEDSETLITDAKYGFIAGALKETYQPNKFKRKVKTETEIIDTFITHKIFGFPIFIFFLWVMFQATFRLGEYPQAWIESLVGYTGSVLDGLLPNSFFKDLLINGIVDGVGGVIVFLPNIVILFFFISFMEDTGYMARAAFIMDKIMHKIGLHGKSFIPLIMGFGCNVPAIMATRTLENKNERLLTMLINPFMSCSARLPVYILIITAFFPKNEVAVLFTVYGIGIFFAVLFAILFKKTIFKSKEIPFVMELPPYRMPTFKTTLRHMWIKSSQYLKKMGGIILVASIIIWALGYFPRNSEMEASYDASLKNARVGYLDLLENTSPGSSESLQLKKEMSQTLQQIELEKANYLQENSLIGKLGNMIQPVMAPLGFDWKMTVSVLAGVAAKEVVVSTMGVLYQTGDDADNISESLVGKLRNAQHKTGQHAGEKVFTPAAAFAFLMFILLYFPCVAVVAAVKRESGKWKWALFMVTYTTAIAWIVAFLVYQTGTMLFS
ncbi:MAG: ferrous iron transport protein B [Bacteroidales bacterium]|nr:ferrous iron transport protein B [Bacteroidales bacterium]